MKDLVELGLYLCVCGCVSWVLPVPAVLRGEKRKKEASRASLLFETFGLLVYVLPSITVWGMLAVALGVKVIELTNFPLVLEESSTLTRGLFFGCFCLGFFPLMFLNTFGKIIYIADNRSWKECFWSFRWVVLIIIISGFMVGASIR